MADVRLRPLREDEWSDWRAWAITEYAGDVARNEGITPERARTHATKELDQDLLPDGIRTTGHRILVAEDMDSGERIGHLWLGPRPQEPDPDPGVAWLYDIYVEEPMRGRGLGRELLRLLEIEVRTVDISRIELNVFGDNERARQLYETAGYTEMARQMAKDLYT
jgi:Acetyltransferase (GNAT) family.